MNKYIESLLNGTQGLSQSLAEKSRKAKVVAELKILIRNEKKTQTKLFVELGEAQYDLTKNDIPDTRDLLIARIDESIARMNEAMEILENLKSEGVKETVDTEETAEVSETEETVEETEEEITEETVEEAVNEAAEDGENDSLLFE